MRPKIYGLTGGICVGKSLVAQMFESAGIPVIDADKISRDIMKPGGEAFKEIVTLFGDVVVKDGELDRSSIRKLVFQNKKLRESLEKITHQRIIDRAFEKAKELYKNGKKIVIFEAAVLLEAGFEKDLDGVIVVIATPEQQRERGMKRDRAAFPEIEAIINAQLSDAQRIKHADYVIDNSGAIEKTKQHVSEVIQKLFSS